MLKKYAVIIGLVVSLTLLFIATRYYPGGSQFDKNSVGFQWTKNYLCNLFASKAMDGSDNPSKPWAIVGMFFLCATFALFFYQFSKKIPSKGAAVVIKYAGCCSMIFGFLVVTPYHDIMVTIAGTGALLSMFYISVFLFKSKLLPLKILSIICLLVSYCTNYIYYTGSYLELLPVVQKLNMLIVIIWILCLEHFTTTADFQLRTTPGGPQE